MAAASKYSYDASGHLKRVVDDAQRVTEYGYDEAGRMIRIVHNGAAIWSVDYDATGWVKSETLADGRTYRFAYSRGNHGELLGAEISDSKGPTRRIRISSVDYSMDELSTGER